MRLKPLRFIGHKIGPFEHIELNWNKDSRYTLIVAENGMGKTTLVVAMAACLSIGDDHLFPHRQFQRFAHDKESFAYFELENQGDFVWIAICPLLRSNVQKFVELLTNYANLQLLDSS